MNKTKIFTFLIVSLLVAESFFMLAQGTTITSESFGNTSVGSSDTIGAGNCKIFGSSFTLLSNNANVTSISAYVNASGTNARAEVAVYNTSYYPLLTSTPLNITATAWYNFTIEAESLLSAGQYYLCLYGQSTDGSNILRFFYTSGAGFYRSNPTTFPTWPDPVSGPTSYSYCLGIYANYTYDLETPVAESTPTTIGLVNTPWAIRYQPKVFYGADRYWVFYVNMTYNYSGGVYGPDNVTHAYFTSTIDEGLTWMAPTDLDVVCEPTGENCQILWNGTQVTVILRQGDTLIARMGTPEQNGTISWLADWQSIWYCAGNSNADFFACLDSNSLPWVSWEIYYIGEGTYHLYVAHSNSTGATWDNPIYGSEETATLLVDDDFQIMNSYIVSLLDGKVYVVYWTGTDIGTGIYGRLWNGTAWGTIETVSTNIAYTQYSLGYETWTRGVEVDSSGNIYYVFLDSNSNLDYVKRTYSNDSWSTTETIAYNVVPFVSPSLSLYGDILYLFYAADKNGISYKTLVTGEWSVRALFLDEHTDLIPTVSPNYKNGIYLNPAGYDGRINPFTQVTGTNFAVLYLTNSTEQNYYKMKFLIIAASTLPVQPGDCYYYFDGLLSESTGSWTNSVNVTAIYSDDSPIANHTMLVNGYTLYQFNVRYVPEYFYYVLTPTVTRYIYLPPTQRNGTFYLYNSTNLTSVTIIFQGNYALYSYVQLQKTVYTLEQKPLNVDRVVFGVSWGSVYAVTLIDGTNYTFHNVVMNDSPITLTIGTEGEPRSTSTFYISPVYIFFGKVGDILGCFGAIAVIVSRVKSIKDGLRGFVVSLIIAMIFFVIWFIMTSLEDFA